MNVNSNTALSSDAAKSAAELIALGQSLTAQFSIGQVPALALLQECGTVEVKTFEHLLPNPLRRRAVVRVDDADSFVAYIRRYQTLANRSQQVVFAEITETDAEFTAILDYHDADVFEPTSKENPSDGENVSTVISPTTGAPQWGQHRVVYSCKRTPEWSRWLGKNGTKMNQVDFAEFIEDNAADINPNGVDGRPSMATMIAVSRTLSATSAGSFTQSIRLSNGDARFKWTESVKGKAEVDGGEVEVPEEFLIGVAPFVGFDGYEMSARLKYRVLDGKLTMWYELERPYKVVEKATGEVIRKVTEQTGLMPFRGSVVSMGLALK
jgi:uncharacterized protein YfdQ (DUF2303 family)